MSKFVSFAILTCKEYIELEQLLSQLNLNRVDNTEIVIVIDEKNYEERILRVIKKYQDLMGNITHYFHPLDMDFSQQKNFLNSKCDGEWIFNIDADEVPSSNLLQNLPELLELNKGVDAMYVPRINIVHGLTKVQAKYWNWHIDDKNYVNFPDWQMRLYRNKPNIKWLNKVHEILSGYSTFGYLPQDDKMALLHVKEINRQKEQNEMYEKIMKGK